MARTFPRCRQSLEFTQAPLTSRQHGFRRRLCLLLEHIENHYRVGRNVLHDPPAHLGIDDPQLVTTGAKAWHRPRVWEAQELAPLQAAQQESRLDSGVRTKGWCLDFAAQPDQRLVTRTHRRRVYVRSDIVASADHRGVLHADDDRRAAQRRARIVDVVWLGYRLLVTVAAIPCVATVVLILVLAQFGIRVGW
jgi:hypothetical protein